jgi:CCR4-NOT transcription complex subunit 1
LTVDIPHPHIVDDAVQRAVKEVINRFSTTAIATTMALIMKDFSMESDESEIKNLAVQMAIQVALSESLALATPKVTVRKSLGQYLREVLHQYRFPLDEDTIEECVNPNLEFSCTFMPRWARSQTVREIKKMVEKELENRRTVPCKSWVTAGWTLCVLLVRYPLWPRIW